VGRNERLEVGHLAGAETLEEILKERGGAAVDHRDQDEGGDEDEGEISAGESAPSADC
jgi:hypothetical protein